MLTGAASVCSGSLPVNTCTRTTMFDDTSAHTLTAPPCTDNAIANSQQALQDPEQQYKCTLALREGLSLLLALAQPPAALEDWEIAAVTNRYSSNSHSSSSSSSGVAAGRSELCLLALSLLKHCCMVAANRAKLVALKVTPLSNLLHLM
jgi:hypothetical protein